MSFQSRLVNFPLNCSIVGYGTAYFFDDMSVGGMI